MTRINLKTIKHFCEDHPLFKEGTIRCHIYDEDKHGLIAWGAVIRTDRRLLINEEAFFDWARHRKEEYGEHTNIGDKIIEEPWEPKESIHIKDLKPTKILGFW